MAQVVRSFVPVSGIPTEVLTAAATTAAPILQLLIIPGNPGNAGFYRTFMQQLHQAFGGRAHVVSCSHAGHDTGPHNLGQQLWTLEQQVQHKADFIEQHLLRPGRPPLVILAHSIGAYMALHAVQRLETTTKQGDGGRTAPRISVQVDARGDDQPDTDITADGSDRLQGNVIMRMSAGRTLTHRNLQNRQERLRTRVHSSRAVGDDDDDTSNLNHDSHLQHHSSASQQRPAILKVVAMMPFLETNFQLEYRQRALRFIASCYRSMATVARLLAALPLVVSIAVVKWWTRGSMDSEAVRTTCQLLRPTTVMQFFFMAHHEFADLSHPFDWGVMRRLSTRLHVLGCPGDLWLSPQQFHHMIQQVPGLQTTWHPKLTHAFCVSSRQCEEVTHLVVQLTTKALNDHNSQTQADGDREDAEQQLQMGTTSANMQNLQACKGFGGGDCACDGAQTAASARAPWLRCKV